MADQYAATWLRLHPDWEMRLWTDANLPKLHNAGIYSSTQNLAQRADILRYEILLQFGGVYIDVDFECLKNIEQLVADVTYFYGDQLPATPNISIIGCVPHHPFSQMCVARVSQKWPWSGDILNETGPAFYRRIILDYLGNHMLSPVADPLTRLKAGNHLVPDNQSPSLTAYLEWVFYPYYMGESWRPEKCPYAYAVHHWERNWNIEPGICADSRQPKVTLSAFRSGTDDTNYVIPELIDMDMYRVNELVQAIRDDRGEILDCGAHIGVFSILLAKFGATQCIKAFEPHLESYNLLCINVRDLPTIEPMNVAVSTRNGSGALQMAPQAARSSLVSPGEDGGITVAQPCRLLDLYEYIRSLDHVALLKLDLEGHEAEILNNAPEDVLAKIHILIVEEHDVPIDHDRLTAAGFWCWFHPLNMPRHSVYRADRPWGRGKVYTASNSLSDVRILVVADLEVLQRRMDKNSFYRHCALGKHPGVRLIGTGQYGFRRGMHVEEIAHIHGKFDFLYHGADLGATGRPLVEGLASLHQLKAMELEDTWNNYSRQEWFLREHHFQYAFHIRRPWEGGYETNCPEVRFIWIPDSVPTEIFRDYGLEKEIDILFFGAISDFYPLRLRICRILEHMSGRGEIRVKIIPHPGYWDQGYIPRENDYVDASLAREINRSWITIATQATFPTVFTKHFEICAANSLLVGSVADSARPFFGSGFVNLEGLSDLEIEITLRGLLADKKSLMERASDAQRRISAEFSLERYSQLFVDLVKRLICAS
jgi:FkbM family methyltransferase